MTRLQRTHDAIRGLLHDWARSRKQVPMFLHVSFGEPSVTLGGVLHVQVPKDWLETVYENGFGRMADTIVLSAKKVRTPKGADAAYRVVGRGFNGSGSSWKFLATFCGKHKFGNSSRDAANRAIRHYENILGLHEEVGHV